MTCKQSPYAADITAAAIQVMLNFAFLIVFLFIYTPYPISNMIKRQIDLVVDTTLSSATPAEKQAVFGNDPGGYTAKLKKSILAQSTKALADYKTQKKNAWLEAFKNYAIVSGVMIVVLITVRLFGFCPSMWTAIKRAAIATFFIAITEFILVNVTKNYLDVESPMEIKMLVGKSISKWVACARNPSSGTCTSLLKK
jgi:hypothetical protein